MDEIPQSQYLSVNDYGGYNPKQLYVNKKYSKYKEEILQHFTIKTFNDTIMHKATEYATSEKVKSLIAGPEWLVKDLQYDVRYESPMSINHVISIILYCDMDKYSTKFSESFRKLFAHESIHAVKRRNSEYWWQSKYFKETVQLFGVCGRANRNGQEKGPFCM